MPDIHPQDIPDPRVDQNPDGCESDEASAARHADELQPVTRTVGYVPMLQAHGVPTPSELGAVYFNQRPATPDIEDLLGKISSLTYDLAAWAERNVPHSPELALAIGAGGKLDEFRGLLKAAVVRRHPQQAANRFPNRYELPD